MSAIGDDGTRRFPDRVTRIAAPVKSQDNIGAAIEGA